MGSKEEHDKLVDDLLFAFGSKREVRIWVRDVGLAESVYTGQLVKYGITGETDLQGIIAPRGRMLCIEAKTGKAVLSPKQVIYKSMVEKFGALYILARSVEQALTEFKTKL